MLNRKIGENISILILLFLVVILLASCSPAEQVIEDIDISKLEEEIYSNLDLMSVEEGNGEDLERFYKIDPNDLLEYFTYTPKTNLEASETLVLKVEDSKDLKEIKAKLENRIESQDESFKDYLPDEHYLIEKSILKTKGDYILYSVSENNDEIEDVFNRFFKK